MKHIFSLLAMLCLTATVSSSYAQNTGGFESANEYVVLASADVQNDAQWIPIVDALKERHSAEVLFYKDSPRDVLKDLKRIKPRYVAIVDKPENIGRDYVIDMHNMSREIDDDIFEDFLWGMITGRDAAAAMRMIENSAEPFVIHDAVATIMETNSAKWFDRYAWVDDHTKGLWGQKKGKDMAVETDTVAPEKVLKKFTDIYAEYDPDLIITAAHASEHRLEMPFSLGYLVPKEGKLMALTKDGESTWDLEQSGKRRVYFAVGNCLIGNMNNTPNSMAATWMNSANAATMIGYVVTTWHGRAGWGALKYWLTTPGRYTLAESVFLNQQDFTNQQNEWYPSLFKKRYPSFGRDEFKEASKVIGKAIKGEPTSDQIGFWHDRDVLAYYGDPKWDLRLQQIPEENGYTVTTKIDKGKCIVTIETKDNFSLDLLKGDKFKQEHVLDLPFSLFFPERLNNPRLAKGQDWKVALDENFLLVYNNDFQPNKTYTIELDIDN